MMRHNSDIPYLSDIALRPKIPKTTAISFGMTKAKKNTEKKKTG